MGFRLNIYLVLYKYLASFDHAFSVLSNQCHRLPDDINHYGESVEGRGIQTQVASSYYIHRTVIHLRILACMMETSYLTDFQKCISIGVHQKYENKGGTIQTFS
jgi:hypothetical protein